MLNQEKTLLAVGYCAITRDKCIHFEHQPSQSDFSTSTKLPWNQGRENHGTGQTLEEKGQRILEKPIEP